MSNGSHGSSNNSTGHNASVNGTSTIITTTTEEYNNVDRIRNNNSVPRDAFLLPVNLNAGNNTNNNISNYINNVAATTTTTIAMAPLILPLSQINPASATITSTTTTSTTAMTTSTIGVNMISTATSIAAAAAVTTVTSPIAKGQVVNEKTLDALGDWLLESASVQSLPPSQEQRRKQSYKSGSLINKTMKQSQEERRRQALAEQAKKRYQFTNHARKLALFASGQQSEESSGSEGSDSQDEEDDDDDEDENEDEEDDEEDNNEDNNDDTEQGKKKKKRGLHKKSSTDKGKNDAQGRKASPVLQAKAISTHKRRLSFGSESESQARRKTDSTGDILSPKKPRLQKKKSSDIAKKKRRRDRNPFRDQMMVPEALTDIPEDLDANYYIVPLPIGHRCFVISADGKTTARLPSGQLLVSAFESSLPAGSSQYRGNRRSDYCILDCVYSSVTRTFWTMDIMCWRGHPVYECETEFRFWWLRGKLAEIEELQGKWIASQTKEWEHDLEKKRMKRARQIRKRQERAAAAAAANAMDGVAIEPTNIAEREEDDDGDGETGIEGMEVESNSKDGGGTNGSTGTTRKFWPVTASRVYASTNSYSFTAFLTANPYVKRRTHIINTARCPSFNTIVITVYSATNNIDHGF
ncbi:hypothetical protein BGX21_009088 [Mortierella sp. AD011]|nr:hypothetical protein BGX21_009088 [Mortierella sp. AD011]